MQTTHSNSIALLIDADNAPAAKIDSILSELAGHGVVKIRRAYGNWTQSGLSGWIKVLHENSIQPMQSFDLVKGKNATDMALVIDALDLLYTKKVTTFCLVSSDSELFEAVDLFEVTREKSIISIRIAKVGGKKVLAKKPVAAEPNGLDDDEMDIPF